MNRRAFILRAVAAATFLAAAVAGYVIEGAAGLFLFPLAVVSAAIWLGITRFIIDCVVTYRRHAARVAQVKARVSRLSTAQLQAISATPSHPDFAHAFIALARRGINVKPTIESLLEMLVSSEPSVRARGMSLLFGFYPEIRFGNGASSADPPEIWRERIARISVGPSATALQPPPADGEPVN